MRKKRTDLKIPYGIMDFRRLRREGYYYVDKTEYLAQMEARDSFIFFVRPRRFGKSLFIAMMESYYDLNQKKDFKKLFGDLWIGKHPTENANRFMTLKLDFSKVGGTGRELQESFEKHIASMLEEFLFRYSEHYDDAFKTAFPGKTAEEKIAAVTARSRTIGIPLYLIIDEYDNFTNQMIRASGVTDYREITHGAGFYRNWFKKFKGEFDRTFMTGVSPVTLDDLTSGFNIATNLSMDPDFNAALGFSEAEVLQMYRDFKGTGVYKSDNPEEVVNSIKPWYGGYCFAKKKVGVECVLDPLSVLYYLESLVFYDMRPRNMIDPNTRLPFDRFRSRKGKIGYEMELAAQNLSISHQRNEFLREQYFKNWKVISELDSAAQSFAYEGKWREFFELVSKNFAETTPIRGGIDGEVRMQGYFQCEMGHLPQFITCPELEMSHGNCDFFLFPERHYYGDVPHSYIVEFKYLKKGAKKAELEAQRKEGVAQLKTYAKDRKIPALAKDTTLHLILVQYRGPKMANCELVGEKQY